MTILMNLLMVSVALASLAVLSFVLWMYDKNQTKWMKMFSERLGLTPANMEAEARQSTPAPQLPEVKQTRFSIPVPGGEMFRKERIKQ